MHPYIYAFYIICFAFANESYWSLRLYDVSTTIRKAKTKLGITNKVYEAKAENRRQRSEEMNESDLLPAPMDTFPDVLNDDSSTDDEDYEEEEDVSAMYEDWINELDREDLQMMAMMMYDYFVRQLKFMKTRAAEEVAKCLGISDRTVRAWRKDFLSNHRSFKESRGKGEWM